MSTSNKSAISSKRAISGCDVLVHHFDTVDGLTPICSESHLLVRFSQLKQVLFDLHLPLLHLLIAKIVIIFHFYYCLAINLLTLHLKI